MNSFCKGFTVCFLFLCLTVKKCWTDGIIYRTPCCTYINTIPDVLKKTPDFAEANGYIAETHSVTTEDGYILTLHRIAGKQTEFIHNEVKRPSKPVVYMQHGIGGTSDNWVLNGPKSFPFLLANAGYDVWLGDSRGNTYSKRHIRLSPDDSRFWDFSFHEQGYYDAAALTNYILRVTGQKKIFYIGHSRGTTMAFVLLSTRPEFNDKFHLVVNYAPVAYLTFFKSPLIRTLFERITIDDIRRIPRKARTLPLPGIEQTAQLKQVFCGDGAPTQPLCLRFLFLFSGYDYDLFNTSKIPVYASHYPDGGSLKEYLHYIEISKADKFQQYDYGPNTNRLVYGQPLPPEYQLEKITAPMAIYYGVNDFLVSEQDLRHLNKRLKSVIAVVRVPFDKFTHMDFLWGTKSDVLLYNPTIQLMNNFLRNQLT